MNSDWVMVIVGVGYVGGCVVQELCVCGWCGCIVLIGVELYLLYEWLLLFKGVLMGECSVV